MRAGLVILAIVVVAAVVAALNSLFIINPTQQALVLQFGQVKNTIREPGLNAKVPFIQDVLILDKRILDLNVPAQEIIAADQKRLVVDAFMRYRIVNPVEFYQTVNNVSEGAQRLNTFVQASLRAVLADATFTDIVRDNRPDLMQRIKEDVAARADAIGVEVVDVKIRRADLPEANSAAIFRRMQTEREQEAREIRAQGAEAARRIEAAADRTATVLRAEARRQSEQIRGEGDARKSAIFAAAYTLDPGFFDFYRSMQAYEQGLRSNGTRLVLSPDGDFFRYFADPRGRLLTGTGTPAATGDDTGEATEPGEEGAADGTPSASLGLAPSGLDPAEVRQRIEEIAGEVLTVDPDAVTPGLAVDTTVGGLLPPGPATAGAASGGTTPAEASTGAAIDEATPAPSGAANEAANETVAPIPEEDIPAMADPDETGDATGETSNGSEAAAASPATSGAVATDDAGTADETDDADPADAAPAPTDEPAARQ